MTEPTAAELIADLDARGALFWRAGPDLLGTRLRPEERTPELAAALRRHKAALLAEADRRGRAADADGWFAPPGAGGHRIRFAAPGAPAEWDVSPAETSGAADEAADERRLAEQLHRLGEELFGGFPTGPFAWSAPGWPDPGPEDWPAAPFRGGVLRRPAAGEAGPAAGQDA